MPLEIALGDLHGDNTLAYQPAKFAAIEGRYDTVSPLPLTLFGIPDDTSENMRDAVQIPALGSWLLAAGAFEGRNDPRTGQFPPD